jgi:hypothetical protein
LLNNFLLALIDLPCDGSVNLIAALPDELFERIDRWMEARLA